MHTSLQSNLVNMLTIILRGAGDPFRYVAAEFYDGADKLPEGAWMPVLARFS